MLQPKHTGLLNGYKNKTHIYAVCKRPTSDIGTHTDFRKTGQECSQRRFSFQTLIQKYKIRCSNYTSPHPPTLATAVVSLRQESWLIFTFREASARLGQRLVLRVTVDLGSLKEKSEKKSGKKWSRKIWNQAWT